MRTESSIGLRGKIISLFFVCFSIMTFIGVVFLESNLHQSFKAIENEEAFKQLVQVSNNFNNELERLNQINSDWGNWDEMYRYLQKPNRDFAEHQINSQALQTVGLKFSAVLNAQNDMIYSIATNLTTGIAENPHAYDNVINNVKKRIQNPIANSSDNCGMDESLEGTVLICWQPVHMTDHSGQFIGTLIVGQLLEGIVMQRIHAQSGIDFQFVKIAPATNIEPRILKAVIDNNSIHLEQDIPNTVSATLFNIVGKPIFLVQMHYSDSVSQRGEAIIWKVISVLMFIAALTGIMLLIGVHYLVIKRMSKLDMDLNSIWRNGRWAERLPVPRRKDELHYLARTINRMLALIRKQMINLESLAHTDALTNIANRRAFDQRLSLELAQHLRTQIPLALLLIDVDHFKRYNDYYGHPAGDEILITIASVLGEVANRPADFPSRIGGEEFAIILPNTTLDGARHVAENISKKLADRQLAHADSPNSEYITLSIGMTEASSNDDPSLLIKRADKATYKAKQAGRNTICSITADEFIFTNQ